MRFHLTYLIATEAQSCDPEIIIYQFVLEVITLSDSWGNGSLLRSESSQSVQACEVLRVQNQEEQSSGNSNRQTEIY